MAISPFTQAAIDFQKKQKPKQPGTIQLSQPVITNVPKPTLPQPQMQKPILQQGSQAAPNFAQTSINQSKLPPNQSTMQGQRFAAPTVVKTNTVVSPAPAGQSIKPSIRNVTNQAVAGINKAIDAADITSGTVAFAPARITELTQGQKFGSSGVPLRFSEGAQQAAQASGLSSKYTAPVGVLAGMIGDPLNLVGGGGKNAAKAGSTASKVIKNALHPEDRNVLTNFINAVRLRGTPNAPQFPEAGFTAAERILEKVGKLPADLNKQAKLAEDIIDGTVDTSKLYATGRPFKNEKPGLFQTIKDAYKNSPLSDERGFIKNPFSQEPTPPKRTEPQSLPQAETAQRTPQPSDLTPQQSLSLSNDINELKRAPEINLSKLAISSKAKTLIKAEAETLRPKLSEVIGKPLSNAEVIKNTEASSKTFSRAVGREQTKEWTTALLNTRQKMADMAETGVVDRDFVETLATLRSIASDAGRKLQSFSIEAKPAEITLKQYMLENMLDLGHNIDDLVKAAEGVDFNNYDEAAAFYRKFVKPKASEWIDLLRYNSMLTSPLTHIVNIAGNLANSALIAPIEKVALGSIDFLSSAALGNERKHFAGEAGSFLKGYFSSINEASMRFADSLKGKVPTSNLDTRNIPLTQKGTAANKVENALAVPLKFLEAGDQFFTALVEGAERAALNYKKSKGVKVDDFETKVSTSALYRLYREEPGREGQGHLLDAVDQLTLLLQKARTSKNPYVSTISKFTFPFVRTPMNIFKQGIEYSPIGYFNLHGATDKQTVLARAAIGSTIFAGAATLLASGRLTWAEPSNETEKNAFKAAGRQPYSVKIGDTWYSYQKLPPPLAFPISMVAAIDDAIKQKKLDEGTGQLILSAVAKYGSFLADQSYAKSMGDLLSAFQGEESSIQKLASNYPQQLIPYRALGGWLSRLTDHVQRKPDPDGTFIDKQVQLLMMNIPGLSDNVPARTDQDGNPIPAPNPIQNAFSPVRSSKSNPDQEEDFNAIMDVKRLEQIATQKTDLLKQQAQEEYNRILTYPDEEQAAHFNELKAANPALAEKVKDLKDMDAIDYTPLERKLKNASVEARAQHFITKIKGLPKEEQNQLVREMQEKKIITKPVLERMKELKNN